jgi:hypothetical protein
VDEFTSELKAGALSLRFLQGPGAPLIRVFCE